MSKTNSKTSNFKLNPFNKTMLNGTISEDGGIIFLTTIRERKMFNKSFLLTFAFICLITFSSCTGENDQNNYNEIVIPKISQPEDCGCMVGKVFDSLCVISEQEINCCAVPDDFWESDVAMSSDVLKELNDNIDDDDVDSFFNDDIIKFCEAKDFFVKCFNPLLIEDIRSKTVTLKRTVGVDVTGNTLGFAYYVVQYNNPDVIVRYDYIIR